VLKENSLGQLYFLISDFDSGAGFVKKYKSLNNNIDISDIIVKKNKLIKYVPLLEVLIKQIRGRG
jgi:hypothetical protein